MTLPALPYSDPIRLHQVGVSLTRRLEPDDAARQRIARALDLKSLDRFVADMEITPTVSGWRMDGRVQAEAVQACVLTLEPLPVAIDERFSINLTETAPEVQANEEGEIDLELDDDSADLVENGQIDLGQYAVEQLALHLDPYPRKEGAVFEQPPEPGEISPFGVLKTLKPDGRKAGGQTDKS